MDWTKSLLSRALIWKEWQNNWGIITVFAVFVSYISTYSFWKSIIYYHSAMKGYEGYDIGYAQYLLNKTQQILHFRSEFVSMNEFAFIFFVVMLGAVMVGREREYKTYDLLMGLPYSRGDIIRNKFAVGLGQLAVIFTLNAVVMTILVQVNKSIGFPYGVGDIWQWALLNVLVLSFIFAFTVFISTLSGTTLGNGLLTYIFMFFPLGFAWLIYANMEVWGLGHTFDAALFPLGQLVLALTPPLYLMVPGFLSNTHLVPGYSIMFVLIFVLYYFIQRLFAVNKLENNGEVLIFGELEGFFKVGVTVCFALLFGPIFVYLFGFDGAERQVLWVFFYLLAGVVFWLLVNLLIKSRKTA